MENAKQMHQFAIAGPYNSDVQNVFVSPTGSNKLMVIEDKAGNMIGIDFRTDGIFAVGSWDSEGEWVQLSLVTFDGFAHGVEFMLNEYREAERSDPKDMPEPKRPTT